MIKVQINQQTFRVCVFDAYQAGWIKLKLSSTHSVWIKFQLKSKGEGRW